MDPKLQKLVSLTLLSIDIQPHDILIEHHPNALTELEQMAQIIKDSFPDFLALLIEHIEANDNNYPKAKAEIKKSQIPDKKQFSTFLDHYEVFFCKYFFSSPQVLRKYNLVPTPASTSAFLDAKSMNVNSR